MKKIILGLFLISTITQAQVNGLQYLHSPRATLNGLTQRLAKEVARDSVNSGTTVLVPTTSYNYAQLDSTPAIPGGNVALTGSYRTAALEIAITKVSGTMAGSIYLQGSVDGTNWNNIEDTATIVNGTSYAFTWVTPRKVGAKESGQIYVNPPILPYAFYRVFIAGTGTWCGTFWTAIVPRQ